MQQEYKQINRKEHPVRMFLSKQIKKWRWYNMGSEKIIQDINENFKKTSEDILSLSVIEELITVIDNVNGEKDDFVVNNILNLVGGNE